jgi:hypothetical protein
VRKLAVTSKWFGNGLLGQYSTTAARRVDWVTDDVVVSLHTSSYTPVQDTHDFWNDATNEISGAGYSTPGLSLSGKSATYDSGTNEMRLDANDASWTSASFTARVAVVYVNTAGATSTDPLLTYVDFGGDETVATGTFSIVWDSTGVAKITAA